MLMMVIISMEKYGIKQRREGLQTMFMLMDLRELGYYLGVSFEREKIKASQADHILQALTGEVPDGIC